MEIEVDVLGSPSLIVLMVSVDVQLGTCSNDRAQELCVKVEVAVLGTPSLIVLMVSVDVQLELAATTELRSCV